MLFRPKVSLFYNRKESTHNRLRFKTKHKVPRIAYILILLKLDDLQVIFVCRYVTWTCNFMFSYSRSQKPNRLVQKPSLPLCLLTFWFWKPSGILFIISDGKCSKPFYQFSSCGDLQGRIGDEHWGLKEMWLDCKAGISHARGLSQCGVFRWRIQIVKHHFLMWRSSGRMLDCKASLPPWKVALACCQTAIAPLNSSAANKMRNKKKQLRVYLLSSFSFHPRSYYARWIIDI